jgi:hypothetical protein
MFSRNRRPTTLVVAAITALALCAVLAPVASAKNGTKQPQATPALYWVHGITGQTQNGKTFHGRYGIQRFIVHNGKVRALGTLKGHIGNRHITRYGVRAPASLEGDTATAMTSQATTCNVLHLLLGPLHLNLLGLRVTLGGGTLGNQPILLDLTAVQGGGLLGDLLCGVDNLLNGSGILSQLNSNVQQLSATLTSLVSLLGGGASTVG